MLQHNLTLAWRNIHKYLSQNIISVVGLSASLICFSICMHFIRFYGEAYDTVENHERIVSIMGKSSYRLYLNKEDGKKLKSLQLNSLSDVCSISWGYRSGYLEGRTGKELPYELTAIETDSSFVALYHPHIVAGSWEQVATHPNSIVLTASAARRIFGSEVEAVGQTLNRNEAVYKDQTYTVRAVMEDWDSQKSWAVCGREDGFDLLRVNELVGGGTMHYYTHGLLADGCSVDDLNRELLTVLTHFPFIGGHERGDMVLVGYHQGEDETTTGIVVSLVFVSIALIVLFVGLFNFLHFLVGTILNRTHEYSMRRLFGCRWRDLFLMLMTQMSMLVIAAGWLCNYVLRWLDVRAIVPQSVFSPDIDRGKLMWEAAEYTGWIFLLCTVICVVLSWRIHRITIQRGIVGNTAAPRHHRRVSRNLLLGFQFFTCWLFITLTVALYMQANLTRNKVFESLTHDEKEQILSVSLSSGLVSIPFQEKPFVCQRLANHSGVKEMMPHSHHVFNWDSDHEFLYKQPEDERCAACPSIENVPLNYFEFMNIELVRGSFPKKEGEVAVDVNFASLFDEDIIGKTFYRKEPSMAYRVTAIVGNTISYNGGRHFNPETVYTVDEHQIMVSRVYLKCHPGQVEAVREYVLAELREIFPESVEPEISTLKDDIESFHNSEIEIQKTLRFISIVSLAITLLGVYSAITIDTERRRREVAIRKVFGARFGNILWMFGRRYFWLLVIPALIAFPIDFLVLDMMRSSSKVFINIGPLFWLGIFLGVALLVVLTILWRILMVARTHPADEIAKE